MKRYVLSAVLVACGTPDGTRDATVDASTVDADNVDAPSDTNHAIVLDEPTFASTPRAFDTRAATTQVFSAITRLGDSVFVVYSTAAPSNDAAIADASLLDASFPVDVSDAADADARDGAATTPSAGLRIFLAVLSNTGATLREATQIDSFGGNCVNARVAPAGDQSGIGVVWQCSSVPGSLSFETHFRAFDANGMPRGNDIRIETMRDGATLTAVAHGQPSLATQRGAGFLLAGSRGLNEQSGLKGYAQLLSATGALSGPAIEWNSATTEQEFQVTVAQPANAPFFALFARTPRVFAVRGDGAETPLGEGEQPAVSSDSVAAWAAFVRPGQNRDLVVYNVSSAVSSTPTFRAAAATQLAFTPSIALDGTGGGLLSWTRREANSRGPILGVRFNATGVVSNEYLLVSRAVSVSFASSSVHLSGDRFMLSWSEGATNREQQVHTQIVEVPGR